RIHVRAPAGNHPDRKTAAHDLSIGGRVRLNPEEPLDAAWMRPKPRDHLIEYEQRSAALGQSTQLSQEFNRLEIGPPTLHRLHEYRGELMGPLAQNGH